VPIYDYKCVPCDRVERDIVAKHNEHIQCPLCGDVMNRLICAPRPVIFRSGWYEHIASEPIYIRSRSQLKAECKEHNCTSDYAEL
jgi:putative FmdB family regulatory protein